jgi:hypothetical protein
MITTAVEVAPKLGLLVPSSDLSSVLRSSVSSCSAVCDARKRTSTPHSNKAVPAWLKSTLTSRPLVSPATQTRSLSLTSNTTTTPIHMSTRVSTRARLQLQEVITMRLHHQWLKASLACRHRTPAALHTMLVLLHIILALLHTTPVLHPTMRLSALHLSKHMAMM